MSVKPKILRSELDESRTIQEPDESDVGELQRQGQQEEELADLELPSLLELDYGGIDAESAPGVRAQSYSMDAIQKGGTQVSVSTFKVDNSPAQEHRPQQKRAQMNGQEERRAGKARLKRGAKSMECKSGGMSIKRQRMGKKIKRAGMEHMRMEPTMIKDMRMQHIMKRSKAVGKRRKPKRFRRRIK